MTISYSHTSGNTIEFDIVLVIMIIIIIITILLDIGTIID